MDNRPRTDTDLTRLTAEDLLGAEAVSPPRKSATGRIASSNNLERQILRDSLLRPGEEAHCSICRDGGWVRRDVMPGDPDFGRAIPCSCTMEQFNAARGDADARISRATLPADAPRQTFATFKAHIAPEAAKAAIEWANGNAAPWLLLHGRPGNGKSHLALAAAHRLIERGRRVQYQIVPTMLDEWRRYLGMERRYDAALKRGENGGSAPEPFESRFYEVLTAEALILDDLGAERESSWAEDKLYQLIDKRYRDAGPLLVVTNLLLDQLPDRVASRLRDRALCRIVRNAAPDFRPYRGTERAS